MCIRVGTNKGYPKLKFPTPNVQQREFNKANGIGRFINIASPLIEIKQNIIFPCIINDTKEKGKK